MPQNYDRCICIHLDLHHQEGRDKCRRTQTYRRHRHGGAEHVYVPHGPQGGRRKVTQRLKPENSQAESTAFARLAAYIVK